MLREKQLVMRLAPVLGPVVAQELQLVEAEVLRLVLAAQEMVLVLARLDHLLLELELAREMLVLEGLVEWVLVAQMAAVLAVMAAILEMMLVAAQLKLKQQRHLQHWLNSLQKTQMLNIAEI
jgi:hypothetical protein